MTVLLGGLRSLGVSASEHGLWNQKVELSNSWFNTLLDMSVKWSETGINSYEATDRVSGKVTRTASRCDLVFGSNSQLRAIVEVYAQNDNSDKFISDFISSWVKVMNADRFD
jgi:catalase-peroxidase